MEFDDLICCTNYGDIGLVTEEQFVSVINEAHAGMINCLKIIMIQFL